MSGKDAAQRLKDKFAHGSPPGRGETKGVLGDALAKGRPGRKRKAEKMAQLNLRVPEELKQRVRILAARDRREMSDIVIEAITLYEARYGAAPVLESARES
jgi:predicted DNA-binding protein